MMTRKTTADNNSKTRLRMLLLKPMMALASMVMTLGLHAANIEKQEFTFSTTPLLKLTRYTCHDSAKEQTGPEPCIIFAFGGGFTHGQRDDKRYTTFFHHMARQGYVVCTIDYRTSLSEFDPADTGADALTGYGTALARAIEDATTDYLTATAFILGHAGEWNINPGQIVACGSSAGAITALQAEYTLINNRPAQIPATFNYAAAVTFAGALFTQGTPSDLNRFCPAMLFQGDADMQVPYNALVLGPVGLYGSHYLAEQFKTLGNTGAFWTESGAGHEMALTPMTRNLPDITAFLDRVLKHHTPGYAWTTFTVPGRGDYRTDFTITDYIKGNMQ